MSRGCLKAYKGGFQPTFCNELDKASLPLFLLYEAQLSYPSQPAAPASPGPRIGSAGIEMNLQNLV